MYRPEPNYLLFFFFLISHIQITKAKEKARMDKAIETKDGIPVFFLELASKADETLTGVSALRVPLHRKLVSG